jgi:hypothetical protein
MTNTIVLYFSKTGTTKNLAEKIANRLGADIAEIHELQTYTPADLDYTDMNSRTTIEQHQHQSRVAIKNDLPDINSYENVIIAHPIWWAIPPRLIATLIDTLDLNDKNVATCATSGGTDYSRSQSFIERTINDNGYQLTLFNGAVLNNRAAMNRWLKSLSFNRQAA